MPVFSLRKMHLCLRSSCRGLFWLLVLVVAVAHNLPAQAQKLNKAKYLSQVSKTAGNQVYEIVVEDIVGAGVGLYSVRTGSEHPITTDARSNPQKIKQDLLVGGSKGQTGTSYTTIRSYRSNRDYVQSEFATSAAPFNPVWLDSVFFNEDSIASADNFMTPIITGMNNTGYRTKYSLPGLASVPDTMEITQQIDVHGSNFNDSWVEITTIVKNTGKRSIDIGIRYFWDLAVAGDDGPLLSEKALNSSFGENEANFDWINFAFYMAEANDSINAAPPAYNVYGSGLTPPNLMRSPFQPVRMQQVSWLLAYFKAFDYTIHPDLNVTTKADPNAGLVGGDNAIQYFWGATRENALSISPGDSIQVTQAIFATLPGVIPAIFDSDPPTCELVAINLGPPKSFEMVAQDVGSGIRLLRYQDVVNANVDIPRFPTGDTNPVHVVASVIDETQPFRFSLRVVDMCGNQIMYDPVFLTLRPELRIFEYQVELVSADRYFYLNNQGVRRIVVNLNGHEFTLSAELNTGRQTNNTFTMPIHGEMTIDMIRYMQEGTNTMNIAFEGPEGSRADVVVSDMILKGRVDLVLDLTPVPQNFALSQNWPNPFRSATTIYFDVPPYEVQPATAGMIELKIYNLLGQLVRTLVDADLPTGSHRAEWDGRDESGRQVAAGVYVYSLRAGGTQVTKKMALIR
ncbi:MAG: T9SS type A sorting domain-containing protein [candidate division KSB1 bacterium]|nr:T9SS type A sorting domain-containing protein [candidate division KSB1 bacterium]MDZ7303330.1 T9SS type A sorting domain-containing protein [candidate division KSB1 bacterium]MDZ7310420.1 T9SS type A sorting domain-containing protein [candidate division KSB1 bacterium]